MSTGAIADSISLDDGSFHISDMAPGEYVVTASLGPERSQSEISLSPSTPDLNISVPDHGAAAQVGGASVSVQQLSAPKKAQTALVDAQKFARRGDNQHAREKLDEALIVSPAFAAALTLRAALNLQEGDTNRALSDARAAAQSDPGYPPGLFVLAAALNHNSQFADAVQAAQQGLRLDPHAWQGHFELGQALAGQSEDAPAVNELNAAAEAAPPSFPGAHLLRAVSLIKLQRYAEAQRDLQEVLRRDPDGPAGAAAQQLLPHTFLPGSQ